MIIYKITNLINNKYYIGQDHKNDPEYYGSGRIINNSIKKYGKENFKKEILEYCVDDDELNEKEIFWINKLNSIVPNGYNITKGGTGGDTFTFQDNIRKEEIKKKRKNTLLEKFGGSPSRGCKLSDDQKKKISESKTGKKYPSRKSAIFSEEHKNNISNSLKGRVVSDVTKSKISEFRKGIKLSEEIKEKISNTLKGNKNAAGYKHTDENRKIMSEKRKGTSNKGYKLSHEQKLKMSISRTGKKRGYYKKKND